MNGFKVKRNHFPLIDIIGDFVIETCLYSKNYIPQAGASEELGVIACSDLYSLNEWKRAERERKRKNYSGEYEINGDELETYRTKKEAIIGHKKYIELGKKGELQVL